MKKIKVSKEAVEKIAKGAGNVIAFTAMFVLPYLSKRDEPRVVSNGFTTYDDAIRVIMSSSMLSGDKVKVVTMLPKHGPIKLYNAVIQVINSTMLSSDKIETIKHICSEE